MASRRRGRGEGKIESVLRESGKRYRLVRTLGGKRVPGPWVKRQSDAVAAWESRHGSAAPASRSFAQEFSLLLPSLKASLAPTNYDQYRITHDHFARTALGEMQTASITAQDVSLALSTLGCGVLARRGHQTRLCAALKRLGHPVALPNVKAPKKPKRKDTDTAAFVKFALSLGRTDALLLLLPRLLGLRRSEALGLRHEDRDEDGVWIVRAVTDTDEAVHEREILKTGRSHAWQALPDELLDMVGPPRSGYVLTDGTEPMRPDTMTARTKMLLETTKWKGFTPQDLRRSFGQAHYERDKDVFGTAALMRHSVKMSEEEYLQTDKDLRRRLMKGTAKGTVRGGKKAKGT